MSDVEPTNIDDLLMDSGEEGEEKGENNNEVIHLSSSISALRNKFQIDVYFFEVYTHCEAPKLISNKIEIHPF